MPTQMEVSCARSRLTYAAGTEDWITFSLYIFLCLLYLVTSICCIAPFTTTSHTCFNFALLSIFNIQWLLLFIFINQPTPYSPTPRFQFLLFLCFFNLNLFPTLFSFWTVQRFAPWLLVATQLLVWLSCWKQSTTHQSFGWCTTISPV